MAAAPSGWKPVTAPANWTPVTKPVAAAPPNWKPVSAPANWTSPTTNKGPFSFDQIRNLWTQHGGNPQVADLMAHVALAESSGNPQAHNQYTEKGKTYHVQGLWQVSDIHGPGNYFDPVANVKKAIELYNSVGLAPWEASRAAWEKYQTAPGPPPGWQSPGKKTLRLHPSTDAEIEAKLPTGGFGGFIRRGLRGLDDAAQNPLTPFNAVLGAPQRAVASLVTQARQNPRGVAEVAALPLIGPATLLDPAGKKAIGNVGYAATHPNDPSIEANYEQTIGANKLKVAKPQNLTDQLRNFGVDFGAQTISDPTILASGGTRAAAPLAEEAMRLLGNRALTHDNATVQALARFLIPHPEERLAFTQPGVAAVRGIRQSETTNVARQLREDQDLIEKHRLDLVQGKMPPEVEQRLLKDAVIYGTDALRKEAIDRMEQNGMTVPKEWTQHPPENILSYHLKDEYFPHMGQTQMPLTLRGALQRRPMNEPLGLFQRKQESEALPDDPMKAIEARLASARAVIRHRMIQKRIATETGMPFELFTKDADQWVPFYSSPHVKALTDKHILDSVKAHQILDNPSIDQLEQVPLLKDISNIGRDTLIRSNPLPHAKNISTLGYLAGGSPGLLKGAYYALTGPPKALAERLEKSGASTHFMQTNPSRFAITSLPGLRKWGDVSARILDRVDQGMRAVRLEALDKQFGNTLTDYEKAMKVNEDLGDYTNSPAYVQVAKAIGGQFPQWHGYIVPTTIARAVVRNAGRVMNLTRANQLANQDVVQPNTKVNAYIGGPLTEASGATTPYGAASYAMSPSMIGPVPNLLYALSQMKSHPTTFNPADIDPELAGQLIPGINIWGPAAGYNPFHSKAPPGMQAGLEAVGGYTKAASVSPYEKSIRDIMVRNGVDRVQAEKIHRTIMHYAH